jgi:hypothetical protein
MSRALDELDAGLVDFRADSAFVSLAARLRPRLGDVVNWNAHGEATALAREFMSSKGSRIEGVLGPLLVRLMAALERYIRTLIEEALVLHAGRAPNYEQLAPHLKTRNTALTGTLLASIESPRSHLTLHFDSLIANLASCQPGSTTYQLNAKAFSAVVAGTGPATLEKALANVGISDWWDKIGSNEGLAKLLGTKGPRATGREARVRLDELWRWRNQLAHGGDEEVALSEDQLQGCVVLVRTFAAVLDSVVLDIVKKSAA